MGASVSILEEYRPQESVSIRKGGYIFGIEAAQKYGVLESVIISKLSAMCERYGKDHGGKLWLECSYESWCFELSNLWSRSTVIKAINHLEERSVIFSKKLSKYGNNHIKSYRVNPIIVKHA